MKNRRFTALALVVMLLVGLLGAFPAQAEGTKQVTLWSRSFEEWYNNLILQRVKEYNALNRGHEVEVEFIAEAAWNERMTAAQAGGTAPDVYTISYNHIVTEARNMAIQPLDGLLTDAQLDNLIPGVRDMVSYDGKAYAYPLWVEPSAMLYYRIDFFEEAGIDKAPVTWEELIETAKLLQNDDRFGLAVAAGGDLCWSTWGVQYGVAGHLAINDNWDAATIDEGYKDLALFYRDLYDAGVVPEQALSGYGSIEPLAQGAVAMQVNGSWAIATLVRDYPELEGKFGVAVLPTKDGNQNVTTATNGGWTLAVDGKAANPDGAADFISYLLCEAPETWGVYYEESLFSRSPGNQTISDYVSAKAEEAGYPWADVINAVASLAIPEPTYPWDISVAVGTMIDQVWMHALEVDDAIAECINSINTIISDQNLAGKNPKNQ